MTSQGMNKKFGAPTLSLALFTIQSEPNLIKTTLDHIRLCHCGNLAAPLLWLQTQENKSFPGITLLNK
jgi:hypothetical protein